MFSSNTRISRRTWLAERAPFKMRLRYESPDGGGVACWNGNISEWEWQQGMNVALMYGFTYDGVNRLKETTQKQKSGTTWSTLAGSYLERGLTYDRNGNIKTLQRTAAGTMVDNLVYTCTGNQLTSLTENVSSTLAGDVYSRGNVATGSYTYDKNGNMTNDSRRALDFGYNVLNLLSEVKTVGGELKAKYDYLADGTKLRVRDKGDVNGFDYLGSLTYRKSGAGLQLESASFGDGVIRPGASNGGQGDVNYFLTDHLGSVRVIVDGTGKVLERNDYYPFGARQARSDYPQLAANRFKYNGKEEQVTGNLEWLDYGARMYDSGLGRWFGVDPFQESFISLSPYNYCSGNPMVFIDPSGALMTHYVDKNYNVLLQTNDGSDDVVMVPDECVGDFKSFARFYQDPSVKSYYDDERWNRYWKNEFGLADRQLSDLELSVANLFHSLSAKNSAVAYYLNNSMVNYWKMMATEFTAQWTTPEFIISGLSMVIAGMQAIESLSVIKGLPSFKSVGAAAKSYANVKKIPENFLIRKGIDPHALKQEFLGKKAPIAHYDLYKETSTGEILIFMKKGKGFPIFTGININDL